jgi:hypothetical protein
MTVQLVGWVTVSTAPLTLHPVPVAAYETRPKPVPPAVPNVMGVPAGPEVEAFEITNAACAAPTNVKSTGAEVALANSPEPALVAVTVQVVGCDAERASIATLQPAPDTAYVTAPVPEPPDVVTVMGVPAIPEVEAFEITNAAWVTP